MSDQRRRPLTRIKDMPVMIGSVFCEACGQDVSDGPVNPTELERILKEHYQACAGGRP